MCLRALLCDFPSHLVSSTRFQFFHFTAVYSLAPFSVHFAIASALGAPALLSAAASRPQSASNALVRSIIITTKCIKRIEEHPQRALFTCSFIDSHIRPI